jgi:hypothetical protein
MFALHFKNGHVAEWQGKGLQNPTRRFDSVCDLARSSVLWQAIVRGGVFPYAPFFLKLTSHTILYYDKKTFFTFSHSVLGFGLSAYDAKMLSGKEDFTECKRSVLKNIYSFFEPPGL